MVLRNTFNGGSGGHPLTSALCGNALCEEEGGEGKGQVPLEALSEYGAHAAALLPEGLQRGSGRAECGGHGVALVPPQQGFAEPECCSLRSLQGS